MTEIKITEQAVLPKRKRTPQRAEMLADVITTALEGGVGYWSKASDYRWWSPSLDGGSALHREGEANAYAVLHEIEAGDCEACSGKGEIIGEFAFGEQEHDCDACAGTGSIPLLVTVDTVAGAMRKIASGQARLADDYVSRIAKAVVKPDEADLDALDCDAIVQVAVLGEVVYG